mgnify:FL=1
MTKTMKCKPTWIDITSAISLPIIAAIGLLIAYVQWKTNQNRLKNELFDRRYEVFINIKTFLSDLSREGNLSSETQDNFRRSIIGIRFIFDKKTYNYVWNDLWCKAVEMDLAHTQKKHTKRAELMKELMTEFSNIEDKFEPYMQLKY